MVNALRGVGVTVHLVGGTTCGKPYGFLPQDNCGTTYFAIQFQGVNQQGFGDYGDGFVPTCAVADDFGHALGDPAEARLAAALTLRSTGACPAAAAAKGSGAELQKAEAAGTPVPAAFAAAREPMARARDHRAALNDVKPKKACDARRTGGIRYWIHSEDIAGRGSVA